MGKVNAFCRYCLICVIQGYRWLISPVLPSSCRFYPTCSEYALESLKKHSFLLSLWLIVKRLLRCHPFSKGGLDPVPENNVFHSKQGICS